MKVQILIKVENTGKLPECFQKSSAADAWKCKCERVNFEEMISRVSRKG